ncbi:MAG: cation diffusion facilitator family transporter [Mycobacteriales bacterium]
MSSAGGRRAVVAALAANLGIALAKFIAFAVTGSGSMLAEGAHSLADSGNQGLLLFGARRAARAPDQQHPFGHGMARYFWAFVVALVLFALGSLFALYEGLEKLHHPHEVDSAGIALGVLALAIVLESFSLRTATREARPLKQGDSWAAFIRHTKSPELAVVLLEDAAALVGLVFAALGVTLTLLTGDAGWDAVGTLAISALLAAVAVVLAIEMQSLLVGEGASPAQVAMIADALCDGADVTRVIHLRTLHLGPDELLVAAKVELGRVGSAAAVARAIDAAEQRLRAAVPIARVVYLEPDVYVAR